MPWKPVSARADGLLSMLGLKSNGRLPDSFAELVQPIIDIQPWYLETTAIEVSQNYDATGPESGFGNAGIQVPDGQLWWVHHHTALIGGFVPPSSVLEVRGLHASAVSRSQYTSLEGEIAPDVVTAAGDPTISQVWAPSLRNYFAPGGTILGARYTKVSITTAGPSTAWKAQVQVKYTPLLV